MGSLYDYAAHCNVLIWELRKSLTTDEIETLRQEFASIGKERFRTWSFASRRFVESWIALTPSQRAKRRLDPQLRRWTILAAIQRLVAARRLLLEVEDHCLYPGASYRDMAVEASKVLDEISEFDPSQWPGNVWDGPGDDF